MSSERGIGAKSHLVALLSAVLQRLNSISKSRAEMIWQRLAFIPSNKIRTFDPCETLSYIDARSAPVERYVVVSAIKKTGYEG